MRLNDFVSHACLLSPDSCSLCGPSYFHHSFVSFLPSSTTVVSGIGLIHLLVQCAVVKKIPIRVV